MVIEMDAKDIIIYKKTVDCPVETITLKQAVSELARHFGKPDTIELSLIDGNLWGTSSSLYINNKAYFEES